MKVAFAIAPALRLPAFSRRAVARSWRLAGLLLAVGVPTLFWTFALSLLGKALGFEIGSGMLIAVGVAVGMLSLIGASLVMAVRSDNT
jgi:hypothetical protein